LGTGLQSVCLGYLTTKDWSYWPLFLIPFTVIGLLLAIKIWHAIPAATKKYFLSLQNASLVVVNTESVEFEVSDSEVLR
jgi:OPA family glycerol-3-phosphate transporter-like MFS transporter